VGVGGGGWVGVLPLHRNANACSLTGSSYGTRNYGTRVRKTLTHVHFTFILRTKHPGTRTHVHMYTYTRAHTHTHARTHTHTHPGTRTHVHMYTYTHTHTHTHVHMQSDRSLLAQVRLAVYKPGGPMAMELSKNPTVLVVNDTVFAHGGLLPIHGERAVGFCSQCVCDA